MMTYLQTFWIGFITLSVTQYACASSAGDARRLLKMLMLKSGHADSDPFHFLLASSLSSLWSSPSGSHGSHIPVRIPTKATNDWEEFPSDSDKFQPEAEVDEGEDEGENTINENETLARNNDEAEEWALGDLEGDLSSRQAANKRFRPSGFLASRGKRFIPGLESLLLARYYRDAEKRKRQPHPGFHGSRG